MPSASYYRAQGKLLETLSRNTSDPELARLYRLHAEDYLQRADQMPDEATAGTSTRRRDRGDDGRRQRA